MANGKMNIVDSLKKILKADRLNSIHVLKYTFYLYMYQNQFALIMLIFHLNKE